jgi:hypothetical protein
MSGNTKTIFVSVASYRDKECPLTISSLFDNAEYPQRVFIGVCQQNKTDDIECFDNQYKYAKQIRIIKLPEYEAKGPTWARYLCSKLWDGEDYYFQIDSHTKLVKGWDTKLIDMISGLQKQDNSKRVVVSHYPPNYEDYGTSEHSKNLVPRICKSFFNDRNMISFNGAEIHNTDGKCYLVPYVAAGMFFCSSQFLKELPFDPYLPYLFVGEEILLSVRFWTNGWDIYTPSENIAYHYYTRSDEPKIWTDQKYSDEQAMQRVKLLLGLQKGQQMMQNELYGMGKTRTLDEYYKFAGIDLQKKRIKKNFCKMGEPEDLEEQKGSGYTSSKYFIFSFLSVISLLFILFVIFF